jgi:hypothetical protein
MTLTAHGALTQHTQHPYPATKVMWIPDRVGDKPDLLGTTGDYMRLWQVGESGDVSLKCLLNNVTLPAPSPSFSSRLVTRVIDRRARHHRTRTRSSVLLSLRSIGTPRIPTSSAHHPSTPRAPSGTSRFAPLSFVAMEGIEVVGAGAHTRFGLHAETIGHHTAYRARQGSVRHCLCPRNGSLRVGRCRRFRSHVRSKVDILSARSS